jgi:hypothetical protein
MASFRLCAQLLAGAFCAPCFGAEIAAADVLDDFSFRVGGMMTRFDTTLWSIGSDGEADMFDFDRELGLKDEKLIEIGAVSWRTARRHEFGIDYFNESLSGTRKLDRDIEFQDEVFPLATTVRSNFTLEAFEFHYTYWPVLDEYSAVGLRIGFVDYRIRTHLRMLLGEQGEPPEVSVEAILADDIPAPTVGVDFRFAPAERWRIGAHLGWFEAEFKTVSPVIITIRAGVEYFLSEDFGVWSDYSLSRLDGDVHSSSFRGGVEIYEGGLRVGMSWRM